MSVSSVATAYDRDQRQKLALALLLLVIALAIFLARDWHNLFGSGETVVSDRTDGTDTASSSAKHVPKRVASAARVHKKASVPVADKAAGETSIVLTRSPRPPLEIEIVAGNGRHTVRASNKAISLGMADSGSAATRDLEGAQTPAPVQLAGERVRLSADANQLAQDSGRVSYPMLARQMKVQGTVILQAMIGSDGAIQDLKVLSGPAILAAAAEQAVRQWRFKPYLQNGVSVETETKITVNFVISRL